MQWIATSGRSYKINISRAFSIPDPLSYGFADVFCQCSLSSVPDETATSFQVSAQNGRKLKNCPLVGLLQVSNCTECTHDHPSVLWRPQTYPPANCSNGFSLE